MESLAFSPTVGLEVVTGDSGEIWMWEQSTRGEARETKGRKLGWSEGEEADREWHGIKTDHTAVALEQDCETGWAKERLRKVKDATLALS